MKALMIGALALLLLAGAFLAGHEAAAAPPQPNSAPAVKTCSQAALLFGQTICAEQLDTDEPTDITHGLQAEHLLAKDLAAQRQLRRQQAMKTLIWRTALIRRFGADAVTPTPDEIARYRQRFDGQMNLSYAADKQTATYVQDLLDKYLYTPDHEKQLADILRAANLSARMFEERQQHTTAVPKEYQFIVDNAENKVAASMLTTWKQDKALYDAYGGTLAATPASGLQPVDAYKKLIAYIEAEGHYTAIDPAFKDSLQDLKAYVDSIKSRAPVPPSVAAHYYSDASWQFGLSNSASRFSDLKAHLDSMPTLGLKKQDASPESLIGGRSLPPSPMPPR